VTYAWNRTARDAEKTGILKAAETAARLHLASIVIFTLAGGAAFVADDLDRPITCALIFVFGVMAIAGLQGTVTGVLVALAASGIYSFFIRDPAFSFALSSADDLVPMIAFNISALASGIFAGRLKDRINAAETAGRRMDALLKISTALHSVVNLEELVAALETFTGRPAELYISGFGGLDRVKHKALAQRLLAQDESSSIRGSIRGYRFLTPSGATCVAVLDVSEGDHLAADVDVNAVVALLSVTVERCLLLERLREPRTPELRILRNAT
jgi:two-component system sensor histidine kinase KdpD